MLKSTSFVLIVFLMSVSGLKAQNRETETLLGSIHRKNIGFMLSPGYSFTKMDKADVSLLNFRAGGVFKDKFTVGAFADFSMNEFVSKSEIQPNLYMDYRSFGGFVEYTVFSNRLIHATFPLKIGGGEIEMDREDHEPQLGESNFFMLEPGAMAEINLLRYLRLSIGAHYRFIGNMQYRNLNQSDIDGLSLHAGLKLGLFER